MITASSRAVPAAAADRAGLCPRRHQVPAVDGQLCDAAAGRFCLHLPGLCPRAAKSAACSGCPAAAKAARRSIAAVSTGPAAAGPDGRIGGGAGCSGSFLHTDRPLPSPGHSSPAPYRLGGRRSSEKLPSHPPISPTSTAAFFRQGIGAFQAAERLPGALLPQRQQQSRQPGGHVLRPRAPDGR